MDNTLTTTEERIMEAAKHIFHTRGYDGARMQEIANEAVVNKSLVHYYYRSKDNLFNAVFEDAIKSLLAKMNEIFFSDHPFVTKIELFLNFYLDLLHHNSYLPMFIINGLHEKPGQMKTMMEKMQLSPQKLLDQIHKQVRDELHIDIDPLHVFMNIVALSIFPVLAKPLIRTIFGRSNDQLDQFYEERKTIVPEFILNAVKGYETHPDNK